MNELELQGWEREIEAWRRRLDATDARAATAVRAELNDLQRDVGALRRHPEREDAMRGVVEQRLMRLLALYDACRARGRDRLTPSA